MLVVALTIFLAMVRAADAAQLAALLRRRYDARPAEQRREQPVDVSADAGTNTLVVVAHEDVFAEIRAFVDDVNRSGDTRADRETMIFALERARAAYATPAADAQAAKSHWKALGYQLKAGSAVAAWQAELPSKS